MSSCCYKEKSFESPIQQYADKINSGLGVDAKPFTGYLNLPEVQKLEVRNCTKYQITR